MKVPVQYERSLTLGNVVEACQDAGLVPLCAFKQTKSELCLNINLDNEETWYMELVRDACPSIEWINYTTPVHRDTSPCPEIDGAFFYQNGDSIGVVTTDGEMKARVSGNKHISGEQLKPYYATCAKEGGNDSGWHKMAPGAPDIVPKRFLHISHPR